MNMLMADIQLSGRDITGSPQATQVVPAESQQAATEFAGVLRSSLSDNSPGKLPDAPQVSELNANISVEVALVEGQLVNWQAQQATEILPASIELETESIDAILASGMQAGEFDLESVIALNLPASGEQSSAQSGTSLPPIAAASDEAAGQQERLTATSAPAAALLNGLSPPETLPAATAIGPTAGSIAAEIPPVLQAAGRVGTSAGLALDGQLPGDDSNASLLKATNHSLVNPSGASVEQSVSETKMNTLLQSNQMQANQSSAASTAVNAAAAGIGGAASAASAATTAALPDSASLSLQGMSLGRGESSGDIGNNLAERVQWMINHRQNTANIRLDPPLLGRLDVQVKVVDDVATVTIQTQQGMTRDMIDAASYRLREALQESGFQSVNVDVSHREEANQANNQQFAESTNRQATLSESDTESDGTTSELWVSGYASPGLIDTFA